MNSNAFTAADMTTAAANGHRDGYQAGYADAVKAVEVGKPAAAQEAVEDASNIIELLLTLAYAAWSLADNADGGSGNDNVSVDRRDFDKVSEALDALDELPDDQPGYVMEAAAKARWALRGILADPVAAAPVDAPSIESAHAMGAKGAPANDAERLAFEAWMRGHCWALCATWDGAGYRSDAEQGGGYCHNAARTRMLWAAWRDRAALASNPAAPGIDNLRSVINALSRSISEAYETACQNGDERMQTVQNARRSLLSTIQESLPLIDASSKGGSEHFQDRLAEIEGRPRPEPEVDEAEEVAACLGDDAAAMLDENPEDERALNMQRAAELLTAMQATSAEVGECNCANGRAECMPDCASRKPTSQGTGVSDA